MGSLEIEAMRVIESAFEELEESARGRVLRWAREKYESAVPTARAEPSRTRKKTNSARKMPPVRTKQKLGIVDDLNLRPRDKESFLDFVGKKMPKSDQEKCVLAVYYVSRV